MSSSPKVQFRVIANPAPLGLLSFASTTLMLSFFNINIRGITNSNMVIGMALACGGLAQFLAGMWSFAVNETFSATAFSLFGAFWISYGLMFVPSLGIVSSYTGDAASQVHNAEGVFLSIWFIVTFILFLATWRSSIALMVTFFFLDLTYLILMAAAFLDSVPITKAGGAVGIVTSVCAYYTGCSMLMTSKTTPIRLPSPKSPWNKRT